MSEPIPHICYLQLIDKGKKIVKAGILIGWNR